MGIPNLNNFLKSRCTDKSIKNIHLNILKNKTIVIDTSIYLYKFLGQNKLIEHFYLLISLLLYYKITPIFVFDGKPPKEKMDTINQRNDIKKMAKENYYLLEETLQNVCDENEKKNIMAKMESLKSDFIRVKEHHKKTVKKIIELYGISYIDAEGEADPICAHMVKTGEAWACLSDDMDMFIYGCTRVLRFISLLKHTVILYDTQNILSELNMNINDFTYITVPCGTDYNDSKLSLENMICNYEKYKTTKTYHDFCSYLLTKNVIDNNTVEICNIFKITEVKYDIQTFCKNIDELKNYLQQDNFIFIH